MCAVFLKRQNNLKEAVTCFKQCLKYESNQSKIAQIKINLCSVLSSLGKHEAALDYVESAILTLEQGLHLDDKPFVSVLAGAYYNCAVEYEFLRNIKAIEYYEKSVELASVLGSDSKYFLTFSEALQKAKAFL
jgi:tetratricopeptide (TPR) repeat protein